MRAAAKTGDPFGTVPLSASSGTSTLASPRRVMRSWPAEVDPELLSARIELSRADAEAEILDETGIAGQQTIDEHRIIGTELDA